jgi:hypothetical protein
MPQQRRQQRVTQQGLFQQQHGSSYQQGDSDPEPLGMEDDERLPSLLVLPSGVAAAAAASAAAGGSSHSSSEDGGVADDDDADSGSNTSSSSTKKSFAADNVVD